jgi:hypothetical protein
MNFLFRINTYDQGRFTERAPLLWRLELRPAEVMKILDAHVVRFET